MNTLDFLSSWHFYHDHHTAAFSQDHFQAYTELMHGNHPPLSPMKINTHSNLSIRLVPTPFPRWRRAVFLPGYGTLPFVTSSVSRMPKDHTSDFIVNLPYNAASGAVHLMGNFAPNERINETSSEQRQNQSTGWQVSVVFCNTCRRTELQASVNKQLHGLWSERTGGWNV